MLLKILRTPADETPAASPPPPRSEPAGAGERRLPVSGSLVLAILIAVAIGVWMSTGRVVVSGTPGGEKALPAPAERLDARTSTPFRVRVRTIEATDRRETLTMRGRTEAEARVEVRAETSARVTERLVDEGDRVEKGDVLCRLDTGAREMKVLEAQALAAKAQLEHDAATRLQGKGFESENRVAATRAALDAANAAVAVARLELERTNITAPVAGWIEKPLAEVGDMLPMAATCATVMDINPMVVTGQVSERNVARLAPAEPATVRLVTGETVDGRIRRISRTADPDTRTFTVEVEVDNVDSRLRDGVTAEVRIPLPPVRAHKLSPGVFTLDDEGRVGVRTVGADNKVGFLPVSIIGQDADGVWVGGLPERVTVITVGQDFVADGQTVEPVAEDAGLAS